MNEGKNVFYLPGATSNCDFLYTAVMAVERDGRLRAGPHTLVMNIHSHAYIHSYVRADKAEKIFKEKIRTNEQLILECVGKANK